MMYIVIHVQHCRKRKLRLACICIHQIEYFSSINAFSVSFALTLHPFILPSEILIDQYLPSLSLAPSPFFLLRMHPTPLIVLSTLSSHFISLHCNNSKYFRITPQKIMPDTIRCLIFVSERYNCLKQIVLRIPSINEIIIKTTTTSTTQTIARHLHNMEYVHHVHSLRSITLIQLNETLGPRSLFTVTKVRAITL